MKSSASYVDFRMSVTAVIPLNNEWFLKKEILRVKLLEKSSYLDVSLFLRPLIG